MRLLFSHQKLTGHLTLKLVLQLAALALGTISSRLLLDKIIHVIHCIRVLL